MGMTAAFVAISPAELEELRSDTGRVDEIFFGRLRERNATSSVDIDKSWAAIHFMLTGEPWGGTPPESLPVLGGTEIGCDKGYGPVRYLEPSRVKEASAVLEGLPPQELKKRFIPAKLEEAGVYPSGIWEDEGEEGFEYIAHWYEQLRTFYRSAAQQGNAVLLAII